MDDLLLFTPSKKAHIAKLEDLLKAFEKEWIENISKEMSIIQDRTPVYGKYNIIKDRRVCVKHLHSQLEAIQKKDPLLLPNNVRVLQEWSIFLVYFVQNYRSC